MIKKSFKILLLLAFLFLLQFNSQAQTYLVSKTEILGNFNGQSYTFQTNLNGYMLIRTDENGSLAWMSSMNIFGSDSVFFCHESRFIVAGLTSFNKRTNKIKDRPSDYEYWLVPFDQIYPGFFCIPNPTKGFIRIILDNKSDIRRFAIYDIFCRLVQTINIENTTELEVSLDNYSDGTYLIQGIDSKGQIIQTIKIIKQ